MGKKTRKTRWRTLSISGTQSDSESIVNGDEGHTNEKHGRLQQRFYQSNNNSHPKYNNHYSSHSTPTRLYNGYHNKYQTSKSTTRSSSTTSENKITFNEEEYTRITTPRQDVLFKKGYLSKPKPYLQQHHHQQQQLTSTGNSTGDGTPDHQSADGTEGGDLGEFEQAPFVFPGSYLDHHSTIYYVNGYEPYAASASHHPMMMYNPTMCYPYVAGGGGAPRVKRYSTDSMTDSTSPSNECQDDAASEFGPMPPCFIYNTGFPPVYDVPPPPQTDSATVAQETTEDVSGEETNKQNTPIKNKRKRRKSKNDNENDETDEDCSTDEESKSHGASATFVQLDEPSSDSKVSPDLNELQTNETTAPSETDTSTTTAIKYRVDAEEFVPRAYRPPANALPPGFVPMPLCPDMMFIPPGMMMAPPPGPHFIPGRFYDMNPFYQTTKVHENIDVTTTNKDIQDGDEMKVMEEVEEVATNHEAVHESPGDAEKTIDDVSDGDNTKQVVPSEKVTSAPPHAIDIAKIVSKLEEAALEQKRLEKEAQQQMKDADDEVRSEKSQKYLDMHSRPARRAQQSHHRERRTHLNSINKKPDKSISTELDTVEPKMNHKTEPATRYTTAISTKEPLLNKKLLSSTTVEAAPAPVQVQEVLPAPVPTPQPTFTEKLKSTTRKLTPPKPVAVCPRLQRQRSRPEVEPRLVKPKTPVQVVAAAVQSRTTPPDAWISVSSKKKRKTKNQEDVEETIDNNDIVEEIEPIAAKLKEETPVVVIKEQLVRMAVESTAKKEPECDLSINESPKKKQNNNNKVKKSRRRIIINDDALLMNGKEESLSVNDKEESPTATTTTTTTQLEDKPVKTEKKPKEIKQIPPTVVESCPPAVIVKTPEVIPVQIETPPVAAKQKKKKKRTNSKVHKEPSDCLDVSGSCDDSSTTSTTDATEGSADDDASKTNVEVSLEIDRMIQRGLYANLEEKIRLFNPSDSFIHASTEKDVEPSLSSVMDGFSFDMVKSLESTNNNNNKLQNFKNFDFSGMLFNGTTMNRTLQRAMTTKMALKTATTSNVCQDVTKTPDDDKTTELTVTELVISPHDSIESLTLDEPTTTATITASIDSVARLQITRAVKEWMDRTRENTPEVEIFKNPQELRQEFLLSDIEDDSDDTISASREGSADLLECWEPEMVADEERPAVVQCECEMRTPSPEAVIEQGEDALEVYESVYGKNADYLRIKSEVKDGGAQASATKAPFGVRDGGLPYRAICCTVM